MLYIQHVQMFMFSSCLNSYYLCRLKHNLSWLSQHVRVLNSLFVLDKSPMCVAQLNMFVPLPAVCVG
jgi:hypothetical protein